jgi:hypothetical protein
MSIESRISKIEEAVANRSGRNDPLFDIRVMYDLTLMDASLPTGDRKEQLARAERLRNAIDSGGDRSGLLPGDMEFSTLGVGLHCGPYEQIT